jgi:hypothetical protein
MIDQYLDEHIRFREQQLRSSLLEASQYRQQFFVINFVIAFNRCEILRKECHEMKFIILSHLR